jgi:hypothetical protein
VKVRVNRSVFVLAVVCVMALATSCQRAAGPGNSNSSNAVANTSTQANANAKPEAARTGESPSSSGGSLATPGESYKTAYAARRDKDIAGLKRVLSKEVLDFMTEMGKEEKKTLDDQLRELTERPQAATAESRNEKIEGEHASLEYLNESGAWSTMDFIKEGNDWKITIPKANK